MAETSFIIDNGRRLNLKDAAARKAIDELNQKIENGVGGGGEKGDPGEDGVSCTHEWNGTVLTVTSASGTSSADLQGPAGADGKDGNSGVYIGSDEPTDSSISVWIDPNGGESPATDASTFVAEYGVTPFSDIWAAFNDGKVCVCTDGTNVCQLASANESLIKFMVVSTAFAAKRMTVTSADAWETADINFEMGGFEADKVMISSSTGNLISSDVNASDLNDMATKTFVASLIGAADTLLGTGEVTA